MGHFAQMVSPAHNKPRRLPPIQQDQYFAPVAPPEMNLANTVHVNNDKKLAAPAACGTQDGF
jgi:hypothetical protein